MQGNIFVTGCGFLARGIMRKAAREKWNANFTLYSRDELRQYECKNKYPDASYYLGDIRDTERMALLMRGHETVIHTAAIKHIPSAEFNVDECIGINIYGTQAVVKAAREAKVKTVIFISTDKSVECANTYGLTKALGERIFFEASWLIPEVKFVATRYGNICASSGSVVPVFKKQFEVNNFVTVTDPSMSRFWLSVDNAVQLIQIAAIQDTGTILIPGDLQAIRIGEIARAIAGDKIAVIGARPGEKIAEKLLTHAESLHCMYDTLFQRKYYVYKPGSEITRDSSIEITSDAADLMDIEEFMAAADDAEQV